MIESGSECIFINNPHTYPPINPGLLLANDFCQSTIRRTLQSRASKTRATQLFWSERCSPTLLHVPWVCSWSSSTCMDPDAAPCKSHSPHLSAAGFPSYSLHSEPGFCGIATVRLRKARSAAAAGPTGASAPKLGMNFRSEFPGFSSLLAASAQLQSQYSPFPGRTRRMKRESDIRVQPERLRMDSFIP